MIFFNYLDWKHLNLVRCDNFTPKNKCQTENQERNSSWLPGSQECQGVMLIMLDISPPWCCCAGCGRSYSPAEEGWQQACCAAVPPSPPADVRSIHTWLLLAGQVRLPGRRGNLHYRSQTEPAGEGEGGLTDQLECWLRSCTELAARWPHRAASRAPTCSQSWS